MLVNRKGQGKRHHHNQFERTGCSPIAIYNSSNEFDPNYNWEEYLAMNFLSIESIPSCKKAKTNEKIAVNSLRVWRGDSER